MVDLPSDALFIGSLLFHFVFPKTLFNCGIPVRFRMRVEDPDIHKGAFESSSPKTVDGNIQPSAVSSSWSSDRGHCRTRRALASERADSSTPRPEFLSVTDIDTKRERAAGLECTALRQ